MNSSVALPPFAATSGPHDASLVVLGEAWGESEEVHQRPFAGQSGRELFRMFSDAWGEPEARELANMRGERDWLLAREAWLAKHSMLLTNVFAARPEKNNLGVWCAAKEELENGYNLPALRRENPRYIRSEHALPELRRLRAELTSARRNLVLCLGATALWSLTGRFAIGALRGATTEGKVLGNGGSKNARANAGTTGPAATDANERAGQASPTSFKLLPTYHPAAIFRSWHWRPIVLADLLKVRRERQQRALVRPTRSIRVSPSLVEVESWTAEALGLGRGLAARLLAPDIETLHGQIRCIGFARSPSDVLVIPFVRGLRGGSYWGDEAHELRAWQCVRALLESNIPKVGQNFLFDLQYITRMGIRPRNVLHDTMLLHHVLFPEMQKGLGFLGSVYTNEASWKLLRRHGEDLKRDE